MPAQDVSSPEGSQAPRPPSFPKMVLLDLRHVTLSPFHWQRRDWLLFAGSTAAVTGLSAADKTLSNRARERNATLGFVGDTFEGLGDGRSFVLLGSFYLAGVIGHGSKAKEVCLDGLSASLVAAGIITPVLATVVGRSRPTVEAGAFSF